MFCRKEWGEQGRGGPGGVLYRDGLVHPRSRWLAYDLPGSLTTGVGLDYWRFNMRDIEKLKITVDRDECIGDGLCAEEAPKTFELDDDAKAVVLEDSTDQRECILEAGKVCPVDAIIIEDKDTGEKLCPEE